MRNFLKKGASGNYFDFKGNVIKNSEPYYMMTMIL